MYNNLFKMCGYSDDEIAANRSRIGTFLERIGANSKADIQHAEERLKEFFREDIEELAGTRKLLRYCMMYCMDAVLARDENDIVIYYNLPSHLHISQPAAFAALESKKKVYIGNGIDMSLLVLGTVFDKVNGLLERAELLGQPAGRAHCSHFQINEALILTGVLPKPDVLWSSGQFCDQAPCADSLSSHLLGFPVLFNDGLDDHPYDAFPDKFAEHTARYQGDRIRRSYEEIGKLIGVKITDEHIVRGFQTIQKTMTSWLTMLELNKNDPQPIHYANLVVGSFPYTAFMVPPKYEKDCLDAMNTLVRDIQKRIKSGKGVVPKGAPVVYMQIDYAVDMSPINLVEDAGLRIGLVFFYKRFGSSFTPSRFKEWPEMLGEFFFHAPIFCGNHASTDYWKECCKDIGADGMILTYAFSCRPYARVAIAAKPVIEKDLGIPVLLSEADSWDTRNYGAEQLRTRVESFAQMLQMKKKTKAA